MEFPKELRDEIENILNGLSVPYMKKTVKNITDRYKNNERTGQSLIRTEDEAAVYSAVRMPATFAAVSSALIHTLQLWKGNIESVIDAGAGTGAAAWAFRMLTDASDYTCIEKEHTMKKLGEKLVSSAKGFSNVRWIEGSVSGEMSRHKADAVVESYMLNELSDNVFSDTIEKLWNSATHLFLIVEPGTPAGFQVIRKARQKLIGMGAGIIAPCTCSDCAIDDDDWCHFTCRVARSRIHKLLKGGDVPYEDEKYTYIAFTKDCMEETKQYSRILRHPEIGKGFVRLTVCDSNGIHKVKTSKKDGDRYKAARKSECGDIISNVDI